MEVQDLIKMIEKDGWQYMYSKGSHRHYEHPGNRERSPSQGIRMMTFRQEHCNLF